jgi:hypothetical protein
VLRSAFAVDGKATFKNCVISKFKYGIELAGGGIGAEKKQEWTIDNTHFSDIVDTAIVVHERYAYNYPSDASFDAVFPDEIEVENSSFEDVYRGISVAHPAASGEIKVARCSFVGGNSGVEAKIMRPSSEIDMTVEYTRFSDVTQPVLNSFDMDVLPEKMAKTKLDNLLIRGWVTYGIRVDYGNVELKRVNDLSKAFSKTFSYPSVTQGMSVGYQSSPDLDAGCGGFPTEFTSSGYGLSLGCPAAIEKVDIEDSSFCGKYGHVPVIQCSGPGCGGSSVGGRYYPAPVVYPPTNAASYKARVLSSSSSSPSYSVYIPNHHDIEFKVKNFTCREAPAGNSYGVAVGLCTRTCSAPAPNHLCSSSTI